MVPVKQLVHSTLYAEVLSYPRPEKLELKKRLKELQKLGVEALGFTGEKQVSNVNVLGKGCVGIVVVAYVGKEKMALKIRRLDSGRSKMLHEARMLERANSVMVGPKLCGYTSNLLLMQFVEGFLFPKWLHRRVGKARVRRILRSVLVQCWLLDSIGLDHGELSHAPKHVIVDKSDRPFIVDFETASVNRRPANVTSICNFFFTSRFAAEVAQKIGETDKKVIIKALRCYKKHRNRDNFDAVLKACGLYTT